MDTLYFWNISINLKINNYDIHVCKSIGLSFSPTRCKYSIDAQNYLFQITLLF